MAKDLRDVKKEYGYVLRWINGYIDESGKVYPYRYFLECTYTGNKIELDHDKFKQLVTFPIGEFKAHNAYDRYVELFNHFDIKPLNEKSRKTRYIKAISEMTINNTMDPNARSNFNRGKASVDKLNKCIHDMRTKIKNAEAILKEE